MLQLTVFKRICFSSIFFFSCHFSPLARSCLVDKNSGYLAHDKPRIEEGAASIHILTLIYAKWVPASTEHAVSEPRRPQQILTPCL